MEGHEKEASEEIMTLKHIYLISWMKIYFTVCDSVNNNSLAFYVETFYCSIAIVCISISVIQTTAPFLAIVLPEVWVFRHPIQHSFYDCLDRLILIMKDNCDKYDTEDNIRVIPSQQ